MSWQEGFQFKPVKRKQCPGDGVRGCLAEIPADRKRCFFCSQTVELARKAAA